MASLFFACSTNEEQGKEETSCSAVKPSAINPNGDSELALLMRQLYVSADSIKQLIVKGDGNISDEFIAELERAHTAIPTDAKVRTPEFTAYNKLIISQAKILKEATDNKEEEFNKLISSCINCHLSFCPGPIKKISKLNIVNPIQ